MKRKWIALACALALLTGTGLAAEADAQVETEVETEVETVVDAEVETEVDTETDAETDTETEPEVDTETDAEVDSETDAETEPEVDAEAETVITYVDVPEEEWFYEVVYEITEKGLMSGIGDGYFGPNEGVNRAMVVTVLWRMEGCPEPEVSNSFVDIDPENPDFWYAPQAAWAKEVGIAKGYEDGTFHGEAPVTREQMASFLYQYAQYKGQPLAQGSLGLFDDAWLVSEWAVDAMRHVVGMGIIQGDAFGNLDPQGPTTRAALATMLHRMMIEAAG